MPGLLKFQVIAAVNSTLPRDGVVNDLYYSYLTVVGDSDALADDMIDVFQGYWYKAGQVRCKVYDVADDGSLGDPISDRIKDEGSPINLNLPGEVALCLSFWAGQRSNPNRRGRIYLQMGSSNFGPVSQRPSSAQREAALTLGDQLAGIGGADISWQVYSQKLRSSEDVTNGWCDDEWDTIRSRGLQRTVQDTRNY